MKASASKHKAMSYARMLKSETELREEVAELLAQAERRDQQEDGLYGRRRRGDEVPEELRRKSSRLAAIRQARAELEAEAARARAEALAERSAQQARGEESAQDHEPPHPPSGSSRELPHHRVPTTAEGKPRDKAQRNFTDPDSRIMKRDGGYVQAYNCQAAVDEERQIIVSCAVTNQPPDQQHLPPLVERIASSCGAYPAKLLADAGYWDEAHVRFCEQRGVDPYIATGRLKHGEPSPPIRGRTPKSLSAKDRMRRKLLTRRGRAEYARRKVLPEPVFGQIRTVQRFGQFLLRGIDKVRDEWALVCGCHNLLKLFRSPVADAA